MRHYIWFVLLCSGVMMLAVASHLLETIETRRLYLRRWLPSDVSPFAAMNADPEVMEYFPATITREQSQMVIDLFENDFVTVGYSFWAVELKEGGAFVGGVGLEPYALTSADSDVPVPHVAIGWQLARAFWGQGLALEAAQAVCEYAKNQLKLKEIISLMAKNNQRSVRLCERLGMVCDSRQPYEDVNFMAGHPLRQQALYRLLLD